MREIITLEVRQDGYYPYTLVIKRDGTIQGRQFLRTREQLDSFIEGFKKYAAPRGHVIIEVWK